jgi:hypothetical protein
MSVITLPCSDLAGGRPMLAVKHLQFFHSWSKKFNNIKEVVSPFWCLVRPQAWYSTTQHFMSNWGGASTTRPSHTSGPPPSVLGCLLFWLMALWYLHWNTLDILFKDLGCAVNWCSIRKASFTWYLLQRKLKQIHFVLTTADNLHHTQLNKEAKKKVKGEDEIKNGKWKKYKSWNK